MFPRSYFPNSYFTRNYWPDGLVSADGPSDGLDDLRKYYALPPEVFDPVLEEITEKVQAYVEAGELTPEVVTAITESMVDTFPQAQVKALMERHQLTEEKVLIEYRKAIKQIILDDELALIMIFASL